MSAILITIQTAERSVQAFVPTRDENDVPIDLEIFVRLVRQQAETLAWYALGYPLSDFLEWGSPWRGLEQATQQEEPPITCFKCGGPARRYLSGATWCNGCDRFDWNCICEKGVPYANPVSAP